MDSIFTALHYCRETSWNTQATGTYQTLRFTGESFARKLKKAISAEIRADRQVADIVTIDADVDGGFNFELTYESFTEILEGALWNDWSEEISISAKGIGINTDGTITASTGATVGSANFYLVEPGHWLKLDGSSDDDNNGYYQVITKTSDTEMTVLPVPNSTVASGTDTITINGTHLRNGVEKYSYSFIREHERVGSKQYFTFMGCVCNEFSLTLDAASVLIGNFSFLGGDATLTQTSTYASNASTVTDSKIINTCGNIVELRENGVLLEGCYVNSIQLTVDNNLRGRKAIAMLGNCGIGGGTCLVTGQMTAYFINNDLYDKYTNGIATSLSFQAKDRNNNVYLFDIPRIKFSQNNINVGGLDQSVMQNINFTAIVDNDFGYTIQISKFGGNGPGPLSYIYLTSDDGNWLTNDAGEYLIA